MLLELEFRPLLEVSRNQHDHVKQQGGKDFTPSV